jgi:hypothetical protein
LLRWKSTPPSSNNGTPQLDATIANSDNSIDLKSVIPAELRERRQWLLHENKRPLQADGRSASSTNAATWATFDDALAALKAKPRRFAGVGFVFTADDPYVGIDLDKCRDAATGDIAPWAQSIIDSLDSYAEVSPSGTGVHILCKGELPGDGSGAKEDYQSGAVEAYQHSRYFTVTGRAIGTARGARHCQNEIEALWREVFGGRALASSAADLPPDPETTVTSEDIEACRTALGALPDSIQGENGSDACLRAACDIRRRRIYGDKGRELLNEYNATKCLPPWSEKELDHKWESARKFVLPAGSEFSIIDDSAEQTADVYKKFPVDSLPEPLRRFVIAAAKAIGCDESYVVLPLLAVLASAIGNSRDLELKPGWLVKAILWTAVIGESGTAKSPAQKVATKAIHDLEHAALCQYAAEIQIYEDEKARRKDSDNSAASVKQPQRVRFIVSDTTVEALAPILQENPRGVLLDRDELGGWLSSFNAYKNSAGADESHWLTMYNAGRLQVDRKTGTRLVYVPRASVSITGGIQPGVLQRMLGVEHRESGLAARFLMAYPPRRSKRWTESGIDQSLAAEIAAVVNRLFELQPESSGDHGFKPVVATLSSGAKAAWIEFYNAHAAEQEKLTGDLASAWSKLEETAARLALVIHYAKWAATPAVDEAAAIEQTLFGDGDESAAQAAATPSVDVLDAADIQAGVTLAEWFKGEARRVYAMLSETTAQAERRKLVDWIQRQGGRATVRDAQNKCGWLKGAGLAQAAMDALVKSGLAHWELPPVGPKGGRQKQVCVLNGHSRDNESMPNSGESDVVSIVDVSQSNVESA